MGNSLCAEKEPKKPQVTIFEGFLPFFIECFAIRNTLPSRMCHFGMRMKITTFSPSFVTSHASSFWRMTVFTAGWRWRSWWRTGWSRGLPRGFIFILWIQFRRRTRRLVEFWNELNQGRTWAVNLCLYKTFVSFLIKGYPSFLYAAELNVSTKYQGLVKGAILCFRNLYFLFSTWREYIYSQPTHFSSQPKK